MSLIVCGDAAFAYDKKEVVKNLNFTVEQGDYLCVLGSNGSGKSTLMKGILGLILPTKGNIGYGEGLKKTEIGYLPQHTRIQRDFPASVKEVVLTGTLSSMGSRPFYTKREKQTAYENMERLSILDIANSSFRELSGGQRQRVLLARSLCAAKRLLLLDEPVAGLDPVVTAQMYSLLKELNTERGLSIIMVSHDVQVANRGANKILHIGGEQLFFGGAEDYLETELAHHYLGGCGDEHH